MCVDVGDTSGTLGRYNSDFYLISPNGHKAQNRRNRQPLQYRTYQRGVDQSSRYTGTLHLHAAASHSLRTSNTVSATDFMKPATFLPGA